MARTNASRYIHRGVVLTFYGSHHIGLQAYRAALPAMLTPVWDEVYTELGMTDYLPVLKEQLLQSASKVDEIKDWSANGLWLES